MEFLLTPGKVTIVIEAYTQVRHIYTDGRPLPADPDLKFHGTSVGRWEGDTLVVETVGFSPLTQLDRGVPHGGKMRILERFRLSDPDTMTIETTIIDPDVEPDVETSSQLDDRGIRVRGEQPQFSRRERQGRCQPVDPGVSSKEGLA